MPTERECVERERKAWVAGVEHMVVKGQLTGDFWPPFPQQAMSRYPLPTVTRPRVVRDPLEHDRRWRVVEGRIETVTLPVYCDTPRGGWLRQGVTLIAPTPERVRLWADLLANPTEEVPADD